MVRKLSAIVLLAGLVTPFAYASTNDNPMENMLAAQMSKQMKALLQVMNDPKMIKANAKYIRSLYEALINEGFTKEQAMELVVASLSSKAS